MITMENKEKVNKLCGTRLREARRAKDLTQQQLADIRYRRGRS